MKALAINGSPRKGWNTATLLTRALEGTASEGAETEIIHLYDLNYKGCTSCFACRLKGGKSYGKCAYKDELTPVLEKVRGVDALILGSPIYMGAATGMMRSFLERLLYPYPVYDPGFSTLYQRKMPTGFIYTMGASEARVKEMRYEDQFMLTKRVLEWVFGSSESLYVYDTYQFDDYSRYALAPGTDPEEKAKRRKEIFPVDCKKAFEMGARIAKAAGEGK